MMEMSGGLFLVWVLSFLAGCGEAALPIVMWHGLGGNRNSRQILQVERLVKEEFPDVYIKSIGLGVNPLDDIYKTLTLHANTQVARGCDLIRQDPNLANGYNAIGISLGGLLLRGVVQRCPSPQMNNFITMGSPHQGLFGWEGCNADLFCQFILRIVTRQAYTSSVQNRYLLAQAWHDPTREATYRQKSTFMAVLNNENVINNAYKQNLMSLSNFVLVRFSQERVVSPESTWFGFYREGSTTLTQTLFESRLYTEDRLGLKQMDREGKLTLLMIDGLHVVFTDAWFRSTIMPYLR